MEKLVPVFLLLVLMGCSSHNTNNVPLRIQKIKKLTVIPVDVKPAHDIHFKQDATYGPSKNVLMGSMGDVVVDSNYIFIEDNQQRTIDIFTPDGRFISQLGGIGKGPGEFVNAPLIGIVSNHLYAFSLLLKRISVFSLDSLALERTINLKPANKDSIKSLVGYGMHQIFFRNDSTFLVGFSPNHIAKMDPDSLRQKYFLINDKGTVISHQIFKRKGLSGNIGFLSVRFGGRQQGAPFKFIPRSVMAISDDNHFFAAWSADFLIKEYDSDGHYLQAFYCPFPKVPLSEDEATKRQEDRPEYFQKVLQHAEIPSTWPALDALKVDDQHRMWVSTIVKNQQVYQWWVLSPKGKLLARFNWPRSKPVQLIKNGYLYTKETNKKGVQRVVRYKIQML